VPTQPDRTPRAAPAALDVDAVRPVAIGTVLWFAAFLVLLPFHGRLVDAGHGLWLWTCLAGGCLGLLGLWLSVRQRAAAARTAAAPEPAPPASHLTDPPDG
jgi:hypothetical protein